MFFLRSGRPRHLYGLPATGLRLFTVYGPWGRPDMAMFILAKAVAEDRPDQTVQLRPDAQRFSLMSTTLLRWSSASYICGYLMRNVSRCQASSLGMDYEKLCCIGNIMVSDYDDFYWRAVWIVIRAGLNRSVGC